MAITNFIPTIWTEHLYRALDKQYVAASHCNRIYEGDIREKGNVVKICGVGNVTVSGYTRNTDLSAPETLSDNVRNLNINRAMYFNFQIDDLDRAQASEGLMELALHNAASALANEADTYILSLVSDASTTVTESALTSQNVIDRILEARTKLMEHNVTDFSQVVVEVSPKVAELILKAKVTLSTNNGEALENGCIGSIGGCRIYVSANVPAVTEDNDEGTTYSCFMRTTRAVAYADQISQVDGYRPQNRFADAMKGLHLYGAKMIYPDEAVKLQFTV